MGGIILSREFFFFELSLEDVHLIRHAQPINIMDSDDSNISDHVGDLVIQPYQFEPLCNDESQQEREHSTSEDSDTDESSQAQDRLGNTDW